MKRDLLFLPLPMLLLASCASEPARRPVLAQAAPLAVETLAVEKQDWPAVYETTGTVRARTTATIASKVMGYVQQVNVQLGDHVREGQLLIVLDARDLDANVRRAEAGRAEAESAVPELENAIAAAKAALDLAQATYKRMDELASKKSISNQEFDEASARLKAAQANYDMACARRKQWNSKIARAEQEVRAAAILQDYAKLPAPFSGVVVAKSVEPGNLAAPGMPLLSIEQDGLYRLEASVEESKLALVHAGQTAEAVIEDQKLLARVSEIAPSIDPASRSYIVKLDLPAGSRLRTGMFGRVMFPLGAQKLVAAPVAAVTESGQLQSVFVIEDGVARTRMVTTGRRSGNAVEVLSGLNAGEKIVLPVPPALRDGARVEVRQ